DAERLWALSRVPALLSAYSDEGSAAEARFVPTIDRYAHEALGEPAQDGHYPDDREVKPLARAVDRRIAGLRKSVEKAQEEAASRLSHLDEEQRLWGISTKNGGGSAHR